MPLMWGSSHSSKNTLGRRLPDLLQQYLRAHLDQPVPHGRDAPLALFGATDHGRNLVQHAEHLVHAALIEHRDLHPGPDQLGGDVGLQVGKTEHAIGFERQDLVDLGAEKGTDPGLFFPRPARAHRVAGDAHDARLLPDQVEPFGGFFGQADNALRARHHGSSPFKNKAAVAAGQDAIQA